MSKKRVQETWAKKYGISREMQDSLALASQMKAAAAQVNRKTSADGAQDWT